MTSTLSFGLTKLSVLFLYKRYMEDSQECMINKSCQNLPRAFVRGYRLDYDHFCCHMDGWFSLREYAPVLPDIRKLDGLRRHF